MRLRLILVGAFFALMCVYAGANAYIISRESSVSSERGWRFTLSESRARILFVKHEGPASALRSGDEVISINGRQIDEKSKIDEFFERVQPGMPYTLAVRRDGELREFQLYTEPFPPSLIAYRVILVILIPAAFLLTGLIIFLLKPYHKQALLLALTFGMFVYPLLYPLTNFPWWLAGVVVTGRIVAPLVFTLGFHLSLLFPEPSPLLRRFPRLEFYLYLPALLITLPYSVALNIMWLVSPGRGQLFAEQFYVLANGFAVLILTYGAAGMLSLALNYRQASQVSRRKIRVVVVSSIVGGLPWLLMTAADVLELSSRLSLTTVWWLKAVVYGVMLLIPPALAYAIMRHQVLPIQLIIRRGLQYLLAKNALRLALTLPAAALAFTIILDRRAPAEILFRNSIYFYLLVALTAALGLVFRRRLGEWLDRKFFRESYNQEKILRELTDDVKKLDSIPEMSRRVTERITAALHPEQIYLFYREDGTRDLSLTYTSGGQNAAQDLKIPEEFRLLRFMEDQGSAQEFPFPQKNSLPQSEKTWLASLGTRLIVPLTGTDDRLAGLLLLGEKKSEVPYTAGDRELLETLAGQIAIVYENVRLKNRVDQDRRIKQEVLSRVAGQDMNVLKECPRCGACFDMTAQTCATDGIELTLSLPVERTIENRYRLEQLIGKGGMGAVYEATDLRLHRKVAVKILTGSMFGNSEALRRFEREAQASARLHHPNIITIHDYGLLSTEGAYLVMELVAGETLGARLKRKRQLAPATAAHIFEQILDGLKSAHAAGVVHRDLKPENVLLSVHETGQARVHLLDFGLAKLTQTLPADSHSPTAAPVTTPGAVMGTFGYMSPEQLMGGTVDERSDLFSIGVMVVEAITGRRPFTGTTYHELLMNILNSPYHLGDASPAAQQLDAALQKSLAKDRAARFASAAAMQQELIPALRQCSSLASQESASLDAETFILKS